jgi:hypothetical protein
MKTINIYTVAVEFPNQTTKVSLHIVEKTGIITKVLDNLTLEVPGIYQNLTSELYNLVLDELVAAGYDVQAGIPGDGVGIQPTP